jgi:predicted PurR-regulated permease PerM
MTIQKVEISQKTIIFLAIFLLSLFVAWQLRSLILLFFLCFIFMEALNPAVLFLQKFKIPEVVAIALLYVVIWSGISFSLAGAIPIIVTETTNLIKILPSTLEKFTLMGVSPIDISTQLKLLENIPGTFATTVLSVFSNLISVFAFFVITFYLLLERKNFEKYATKFFNQNDSAKAVEILKLLELRLGRWVSGQFFLMILIGILSYFGYLAIGLNYALPLGIIAGFLEMVPNIGPVVTSILAGLVGLTVSPTVGLMAVGWGIIVQQLENNFIVPKIMKDNLGLNPLVTIFLIAIGGSLAGIIGAIIAIPLFLTASVFYQVLKK